MNSEFGDYCAKLVTAVLVLEEVVKMVVAGWWSARMVAVTEVVQQMSGAAGATRR